MHSQMIFLDIPYDPNVEYYNYQLPPQTYENMCLDEFTIVTWALEGVDLSLSTAPVPAVTGPLYFQLKFDGDLECSTLSNTSMMGCIQLPIETMGGWPAAQMAMSTISFPIKKNKQQTGRIRLQVLKDGISPGKLVFTRLCIWITVKYAPVRGSTVQYTL